jgi:hypothetical protein
MKNASKLPMFPVGALELILECQEILAGQRTQLTRIDEYKEQRQRYWQMQALRPRQRQYPPLREQAA